MKGKGTSARLRENPGRLELVKIVFRSWRQVLASFPNLLQKRKFVQENRKISTYGFGELLKKFESDLDRVIFGS